MGAFLGGILASNPVTAVISGISAIIGAIAGLGNNTKAFAHDVGVSLKLLWGAIIGPIAGTLALIKKGIIDLIRRVKRIIDDLKAKLGKILDPIIAHAKAVRDLWDHLFNRFIAPILQAIQHIRQTLTIFKVFHLKWATALDSRLAKLEGEIASRFLIVKQKLNQAITTIELWTDPYGYIKDVAIWPALTQSIAGLRGLILGFNFTSTTASKPKPTQQQLYQAAAASWTDTFQRWTTGNLTANEKEWSDGLRSFWP